MNRRTHHIRIQEGVRIVTPMLVSTPHGGQKVKNKYSKAASKRKRSASPMSTPSSSQKKPRHDEAALGFDSQSELSDHGVEVWIDDEMPKETKVCLLLQGEQCYLIIDEVTTRFIAGVVTDAAEVLGGIAGAGEPHEWRCLRYLPRDQWHVAVPGLYRLVTHVPGLLPERPPTPSHAPGPVLARKILRD